MQIRLSNGKVRLRNGKAALINSTPPPVVLTNIEVGMIGQSNMVGLPTTPNIYPLGDIRSTAYTRAGATVRIGNFNDARPVNEQSNLGAFTAGVERGDGFVFFANNLAAATGATVRLIERGVGGSNIAEWADGSTNWNAFVAAVTAAGNGLDAVIWYQGESNAASLNVASYTAALNSLYTRCLALSGRTADKFHFGIISLGVGSFGGSVEGQFGAMRAAQVNWANSTTGAFFASSGHDSFTSDGVHNVGSGAGRIGSRAGKSLAARFGCGVTAAGPRITGATRSGTAVTLAIAHTGGTALRDGAGGTTGAGLTGFEFKDAGAGNALIAYTTAFVGGNVVCTLANTPAGALTVSYAMANTPHGTSSTVAPVFASIPCDNVTYPGAVYGAPLQALAAITVSGS